jgi:hypothetical protein
MRCLGYIEMNFDLMRTICSLYYEHALISIYEFKIMGAKFS